MIQLLLNLIDYGNDCVPGGHLGLQSRCSSEELEGGFDSHTFPQI